MAWNEKYSAAQRPITPIIGSKPRIAIGIPHEEKATFWWFMRMFAPLIYAPLDWADKVPQMVRGVPLPVSRDQIVELSLKDPAVTHILWVDTDNISVKPENPNVALQMLHQCNQPIVSGLYRAKQAAGFNYAMWMKANLPNNELGFTPIEKWTGNWLQVDVIGMGFCLVKREVYERIPSPWHPWPTATPSEDFRFCLKAKEYGYNVNVFTEVQLRHLGTLSVEPDGNVKVLEM